MECLRHNIKNINPEGDVTFVASPGKFPFWVSSAVLRNASPVFSVMHGHDFSEVQSLRKDHVEVPVPEDDPEAFYTIMCVLHSRNDIIRNVISNKELHAVAVLSKTYDLAVALKSAS